MNYDEFKKQINITQKSICRDIFRRNRDAIQIKKEDTVIRNLEKIFTATLKISNKKGFQAMGMRDLSRETGLSAGALYSYFSSKEELLEMMQHQRRAIVKQVLDEYLQPEAAPAQRLETLIKTHLYLSEVMQPWFYFSYMEAKNLPKAQMDLVLAGSRYTEDLIAEILIAGGQAGVFLPRDPRLSAAVIKAMLQDWYLKRQKYAKQKVSVDRYAAFVLEFVTAFVGRRSPAEAAGQTPAGQ